MESQNQAIMNQVRELGWDDTIENDGQEFVLLPEGDYPFVVTSFERGRYEPKPGGKMPPCNKAVLSICVTAPDGQQTTIKHNLFLCSTQEWKLCEFFAGIGARKKGEPLKMNWNLVPSATGTCHVKIHKYDRRDGGQGESNEITKFYPKEASGFTPGKF